MSHPYIELANQFFILFLWLFYLILKDFISNTNYVSINSTSIIHVSHKILSISKRLTTSRTSNLMCNFLSSCSTAIDRPFLRLQNSTVTLVIIPAIIENSYNRLKITSLWFVKDNDYPQTDWKFEIPNPICINFPSCSKD